MPDLVKMYNSVNSAVDISKLVYCLFQIISVKYGTYSNFGLNMALCPPSNLNSNLNADLVCKRVTLSIADFLRADKTPATSNSSLYNSF